MFCAINLKKNRFDTSLILNAFFALSLNLQVIVFSKVPKTNLSELEATRIAYRKMKLVSRKQEQQVSSERR